MKRTWLVLALAGMVGPVCAAVNEVRVVAVQPEVQFHKAGTPDDAWLPVEKDTVLQQGDEISCDPDGAATLQFADNSTVVVKNTTQLKIASFFTEGGVVKTEILLKMGEVAAKVHKSEATKSDFRIKSPTGTASVRGTELKEVSYNPVNGMKVVLVEGFANLAGTRGTTQVTANEEGQVDGKGDTKSPVQTQSDDFTADTVITGSSDSEYDLVDGQVTNQQLGTGITDATGGSDGVATVATENLVGDVAVARVIDFNDGAIPADITAESAAVTAPGAFGPSSADGTNQLTITTGGENGNVGFAALSANFPTGATMEIQFDHNFITTEEPGQFFANDDEFTAQLVSNGNHTVLARHSVFSSSFKQIDPSTLPASMNLPGGNQPEVAFETGFQRFKGTVQIPAGDLELLFLVRDGDTAPGVPDTIVESAAQIDNISATVLTQSSGGVTVITPIGDFTGTGAGTHPVPLPAQVRLPGQ